MRLVLISVFCLTISAGCSNPVSRFSKQYKCEISGKPEPQTAREYVDRGLEHASVQELECALGACSEAIRLDQRLATGYSCRGAVLNTKGDYLKALEDFDLAIELQPGNGDFFYSRGLIHEKLEHLEQALADATKATELTSSTVGRSVAYAFRGSLLRKQGKLKDALAAYDEAIRLSPNFAYHFLNRGSVFMEARNFERALADYKRAISLDPSNPHFLRERANVYRELGRADLANQDDSAANSLSSGTPTSDGSPIPQR
jgi:tetratricopeptide (TPR) repeat protein